MLNLPKLKWESLGTFSGLDKHVIGHPEILYKKLDKKLAEKFLKKAIQLMPNDPIVNDHYGDVLWKLHRKIQAKYYWQSALNSKESEEEMKKNISKKLLKGLIES